MGVKNLCTGTKWLFIPDIIKEEFIKLATHKDINAFVNKNVKKIEEVYDWEIEKVFFEYITDEVIFYIKQMDYDNLKIHLGNKLCRDGTFNIITENEIEPFLIEYGEGFIKGYTEFETKFQKDIPSYRYSVEDIRQKFFIRIKECKKTIPLFSNNIDFDTLPSDTPFLFTKDKSVIYYMLDNTQLFLTGIEDGEFYKAWEIILETPLLFKPLFEGFSLKKGDHSEQSEVKFGDSSNTSLEGSVAPEPEGETFCNNGFALFEYLMANHIRDVGVHGRFSDIADYYWKMYENKKYIHQRPEAFKIWFYKKYNQEYIGKIKTAVRIKDKDRDKHYLTSLKWFKTRTV